MSHRLPVIRQGRAYESLEQREVIDVRSGSSLAVMGLANAGLVARDIARWPTTIAPNRKRLATIFEAAANGLLDASDLENELMVERVAATTGLTKTQVVAQMGRLAASLRSLELHMPETSRAREPMGFVLPSNAPGVHSSWLAALALGHPVALKPGAREPWTPYRLAELLWGAGLPESMIGIYAGDHATSRAMVETASSCVLFGDESTVERYRGVSSVDVRGPGRSKALVTVEAARDPDVLRRLSDAITELGGRSCLNTSNIGIVDGSPEDLEALSSALKSRFCALAPDSLAAWPTRAQAEGIAAWLTDLGGAEATPSLVERTDGLWALKAHAMVVRPWTSELASLEAPCPWVGITSLPESEASSWTGGSLAVSVHGSGSDVERLVGGLEGVERVVPAGQVTTDATDTGYHVAALKSLAP